MKQRSWSVTVAALLVGLGIAGPGVRAQQLDRTQARDILVEALRYVIEVHLESRYSYPVLLRATVDPELADSLGFDPTGIVEAASQELGIPIQEYRADTFCDTDRYRPYLRSRQADLRIGATLTSVSGTRASVGIWFTRGTLLSGSTHHTLYLEQTSEGWSATGFEGTIMHGHMASCVPPAPSRPAGEITSLLSVVILELLENPVEEPPIRDVRHVCLWDSFRAWDEEVESGIRERLERAGVTVGETCIRRSDVEDKLLLQTPGGEPAIIFELRFIVTDSEDRVVLQIGVNTGNTSGRCVGRLGRACVLECAVDRRGSDWGKPSCNIAPFSDRGERINPTGRSQIAVRRRPTGPALSAAFYINDLGQMVGNHGTSPTLEDSISRPHYGLSGVADKPRGAPEQENNDDER